MYYIHTNITICSENQIYSNYFKINKTITNVYLNL
jgi:hypothetical protein